MYMEQNGAESRSSRAGGVSSYLVLPESPRFDDSTRTLEIQIGPELLVLKKQWCMAKPWAKLYDYC